MLHIKLFKRYIKFLIIYLLLTLYNNFFTYLFILLKLITLLFDTDLNNNLSYSEATISNSQDYIETILEGNINSGYIT